MGDSVTTKSGGSQSEATMTGWLFKWTNYFMGYQKRWFVLQNGHLSYYKNETKTGDACKGSISLHGALISTLDLRTFEISNEGTRTFNLKAPSIEEAKSWITALIAQTNNGESEKDVEAEEFDERQDMLEKLKRSLNELQICKELLEKSWKNLEEPLSEIESAPDPVVLSEKAKEICERATLFRIAGNAMINSGADYLRTAQTHGHQLVKLVQHKREQR